MPKSLAEGTLPIPEGTSSTIDESPNGRLDSWKEIAVYFRRDVRTVRRWEQSLGLPVHRHRQRRGVAVYAYRSEVDEWWRRRDQKAEAAAPAPARDRRRSLPLVWAAVASLGALGILLGVWREPPPPATQRSALPVTSYPGIEEYPSLSPDGNRLAFCWSGDGGRNVDIYIKSLDTSLADPVRLTTDSAPDVSPVWAPDGRSVAFVRQTAPGELKVMLIPSVGGVEREVKTAQGTWEREAGSYLAWTPDGKGLVFLDRESPAAPAGLFLFSLESGESRRLTTPPHGWWGDSSPAFSPDGRQLAFERLKTLTGSDIYSLALNEDWTARGEPRRVTTTEHGAASPVWISDGKEILFLAGKGGEPRIQRISAAGSGPAAEVVSGALLPAFSAAGSKLVYSRGSFDTNIWRIELDASRDRAAGGPSFIASTLNDSWADYCPRGENVVYVSDRSGTPELWISDANGSNSRQLTSLGGPRLGAPRWAPGGEYIAFAAWQGGSADIYTVHGAGGAPAPVTADPAEDLWPSWSRDGRWIYFASNRGGDWQVWKKPAESGNATQVTQNGGGAAMESHDGRFLYFTKGQGTAALWEMPLAEARGARPGSGTGPQPDSGTGLQPGEERLLAENLFGTANFYVAGNGVYFVARPEGSSASSKGQISPLRDRTPCPQEQPRAGAASCGYVLQFLRFSTGKIERVTTIKQPTDFGLTVSADGRWLLYPQWDEFEADLILQELPE